MRRLSTEEVPGLCRLQRMGPSHPPKGQGCLTQIMFSKLRLEDTCLAGRRRGEFLCTECLCSGTARHTFIWEILRVK